MNEYDIQVDLEHGLLFNKQIDLVQNDYNSTVFNFKFNNKNYSSYIKVFQLEYPDGKTWIKEIKEDKITLADLSDDGNYVSILTQSGKYYFDIAIYDEISKLTTTKKSYFNTRKKISGENIDLDDRAPILDDLINSATKNINETNNLDIDIENSVITITKKDGTTKSENVKGDAYVITDEDMQEIENNVKGDIQPIIDEAKENSETAISIAKGANQALDYLDYANMITNFNAFEKNKFSTGQNIMIKKLNVPDMWIYQLSEEYKPYTYTTDEEVINLLLSDVGFQVGYYVLSALETQKVDLTEYVKNTDMATSTKAGLIKLGPKNTGLQYDPSGYLKIVTATKSDIDNKQDIYKPITPGFLDYAVKSVVGGQETLTQTEYDELVAKGTYTREDGTVLIYSDNDYYNIVEE